MAKFESTIESLENALTKEKEMREEGEVKIWKLSQEIENSESELKILQVEYHDNLTTIESKVIIAHKCPPIRRMSSNSLICPPSPPIFHFVLQKSSKKQKNLVEKEKSPHEKFEHTLT